MEKKIEINIKLPTIDEVIKKATIEVPIDIGAPDYSSRLREALNPYSEQKGCYIQVLQKNKNTKVIQYVGQTSKQTFYSRIKFEFNYIARGTSKFYTTLNQEINNGKKIFIALYSDEELKEMCSLPVSKGDNEELKQKNFRLIIERAMINAYYSETLLNTN